MSAAAIAGVVLCRVGEARLAADCAEIDAIVESSGDGLSAALAFGAGGDPRPRALQVRGRLLGVDSVDVVETPGLLVLSVPPLLQSAAGGAMTGFIEWSGALWPLVSVGRLLEHLEALP